LDKKPHSEKIKFKVTPYSMGVLPGIDETKLREILSDIQAEQA